MSTPHPEGRPRRKTLQTVNARAAVQSVLGPSCGLKRVPYPPDPGLAASVRGRWLTRLRELRDRGFQPLACDADFRRAERCPWRLYGLDDAGGRPCHRPGCPSCHGEETALAVDRVLRVVGDRGTAKLRLVRSTRAVTGAGLDAALEVPPPKAAAGYMRQVGVERAGPDACGVTTSYLVLGGRSGQKVGPRPLAVARAVAAMRPYPAAHLDLDPGLLLDTLRRLAGRRLSSCAGAFRIATQERPTHERYARAARTLGGCAPTFLRRPAGRGKAAGEAAPELAPSDDDGLVRVVLKGRPEAVGTEFERTDHLTHAEMLAELELRRLEWVPGYEAWLEMTEAYWDAHWEAHDGAGEVEYVTADEAEWLAQQADSDHMDAVEAMVEREVRRNRNPCEACAAGRKCYRCGGRPYVRLEARVRAIVEEHMGVELETTIRLSEGARVELDGVRTDAPSSTGT